MGPRPWGSEDRVHDLLLRAGVREAWSTRTGVLGGEPVLVFQGESRKTLGIYDPEGSEIGEAIRIEDRYSEVGYRYHYELRDQELRCALRDTTRRRFGIDSWYYTFLVLGPDGTEIGTVTQSGRSNHSYAIASGGRSIAAVHRASRLKAMSERRSSFSGETLFRRGQWLVDGMTSEMWCVEDEPGIVWLGSPTLASGESHTS